METERLFDEDSFTKKFTARVISCDAQGDGWRVVLDRTGFFPEGGGQTADTGILRPVVFPGRTQMAADAFREEEKGCIGLPKAGKSQANVLDVQQREGCIFHMTDRPFEPGIQVEGILNWEERFSKMQHHSGEHIVSGLVHRYFGYNNVGFHLGSREVTLDFDGVLTKEQLRLIERKANEAVAADIAISASYPSREELGRLQYRSKIEIEGQVRIVAIPGYDVCACCAPHMRTTGQIGIIKLVNMHNYKGGIRVSLLCGFAALEDYCEKEDSVKAIALSLSTHESQAAEGVERLKEEIFRQKGEIQKLQNQLLDCKAAPFPKNAEKAILFDEALTGDQPRELANKLLERGAELAAVFAGTQEEGYRYVVGSRSFDVRGIVKSMNQKFHGRGGGKAEMAQGSLKAGQKEIQAFFASLQLAAGGNFS